MTLGRHAETPARVAAFSHLHVSSEREANIVGSFPITRSIIDQLSMDQIMTLPDLQLSSVAARVMLSREHWRRQ